MPSLSPLPSFRPTVASIDLGALARNVRTLKAFAPVRFMAVVKADAYGHGAVRCVPTLLEAGADALAVALPEEALELRQAGIRAPILVLGRMPVAALPHMLRAHITCAVTCMDDVLAVQAAAREQGCRAVVHVKLDTGMSRLGLQAHEVGPVFDALAACEAVQVEGLFTHFAAADGEDLTFTHHQYAQFCAATATLRAQGRCPELLHCCASPGMLRLAAAHGTMVRPGIVMYGYHPSPSCTGVTLEPVMHLRSQIVSVHTFEAGRTISYGCTYVCKEPRRIGLIPAGYADGVPRALSGQGTVLVDGQVAPLVGRVCMDMCMVDLTDVAAGEGAAVVLFGNPAVHGAGCATAETWAGLIHGLHYEVLCGVSKRVPRVYGL